jgi:hypothetical protein
LSFCAFARRQPRIRPRAIGRHDDATEIREQSCRRGGIVDVGRIAMQAGVGKLAPSHLVPMRFTGMSDHQDSESAGAASRGRRRRPGSEGSEASWRGLRTAAGL